MRFLRLQPCYWCMLSYINKDESYSCSCVKIQHGDSIGFHTFTTFIASRRSQVWCEFRSCFLCSYFILLECESNVLLRSSRANELLTTLKWWLLTSESLLPSVSVLGSESHNPSGQWRCILCGFSCLYWHISHGTIVSSPRNLLLQYITTNFLVIEDGRSFFCLITHKVKTYSKWRYACALTVVSIQPRPFYVRCPQVSAPSRLG